MIEQNQTHPSDILIVGGGPVGMMMALLLLQRNFAVTMVDRLDYGTVLAADYDGRTFAYAYGSKEILENAGLWKTLEPHATPIMDIMVTGEGPGQGLHYAAHEVGDHPMGYNIETRHFRSTVFQSLQSFANFSLLAPHEIQDIAFDANQASVLLKGSSTRLTAPLMVAADGKNSMVRSHVGIPSKRASYDQKALVFVIDHEKSHQNCAYEHFLKTGPLAILPMEGHRSGVIWSLSSDRADHFHALSDTDLAQEVASHFIPILGAINVVGERWLFPLDVSVVKKYVAPRCVLIGDAAHAIHPVAGQGFNLGLRDALVLADHLSNVRSLGLDLGSLSHLETYEKSRRGDVFSMTAMCDGLVRLFSNDGKTLGHLRRAGLDITNAIPPLKRFLTRRAMGLSDF